MGRHGFKFPAPMSPLVDSEPVSLLLLSPPHRIVVGGRGRHVYFPEFVGQGKGEIAAECENYCGREVEDGKTDADSAADRCRLFPIGGAFKCTFPPTLPTHK